MNPHKRCERAAFNCSKFSILNQVSPKNNSHPLNISYKNVVILSDNKKQVYNEKGVSVL